MAGKMPQWEGLLKWSLKHSDGTKPAREISESEKQWFMEAMKHSTVDAAERMREIAMLLNLPREELERQGVEPKDMEGVLEELLELVETIDMANDLHAVGGLVPLLNQLRSPEAGLRSRAAEVVATAVQNNPQSQKNVMDNKGMELLMHNLRQDEDMTSRTKALGALSSLIRHNKLGLEAFNLSNGLGALRDALGSEHVPLQRKALQLLRYVIAEGRGSSNAGSELSLIRTLASFLTHPDADVREAALAALAAISAQSNEERTACAQAGQLKDALKKRIEEIASMNREDRAAARDEASLIDHLWGALYNEPSPRRSLAEKQAAEGGLEEDDAGEAEKSRVAIKERERKPYSSVSVRRPEAEKPPEDANAAPLLLGPGESSKQEE